MDTINATALEAPHPYFPVDATLPGFIANTISGPMLVVYFAAGSGAILSTAFAILSRANPNLSRKDVSIALWFTLCGFIHFFFEGIAPLPFLCGET
jgi:cholestenol Delta-isomerase